MGCDIHLYKEKQIDGKWLTADEWVAYDYGDDEKGIEVPWEKRYTGRNYQLFGLLSKGVRCEHPFSFAPRGLPFNACEEIAGESERWDADGHGHSYLYLHELRDMSKALGSLSINIKGMKDRCELAALQATIETGNPDWSLLFPYCGWGSSENLVEFELDVPASFYIGNGLGEIISSFDGIEGENHRIVFFFDN